MQRAFVLLAPLLLMSGCEWMNETLGWGPGRPDREDEPPRRDTIRWDTGRWEEPEVWSPEPLINSVLPVASGTEGATTFTLNVSFGGWVDEVSVDIAASGDDDRIERFTFPADALIERCQDGGCDEWEHRIAEGDAYDDDEALMTFDRTDLIDNTGVYGDVAFRVQAVPFDPAYDVQCAMWGHRARELYGDECECFEAFLASPPADPCGSHD